MDNYKHIKERFDDMKTERSNWNVMYQVLGEYISQIKQDFEGQPSRGEFLTDEIYDSTGTFAAHSAASALLGMLWGGTTKQTLEIVPPEGMPESTELSAFYENMTDELARAMDDPKANLVLALDEYMLDQLIFATSGIGVESGEDSDLLYKPYGVKEMYIDEGKNGRVDTIALFYEWTAKRVINEYGEENVSDKVKKAAASNSKDRVKILIFIQKRMEKKAKKGKYAMPYESLHLEYDTCHLLREEGFFELPIAVARFRKLAYEKYGRGMGMMALPDIKEANALREAIIIATEKILDMPIGVLDDGIAGSGYIDTSARAVTVFNASNSMGSTPPVFDIGTPPRIEYAEARLEKLTQNISQHFAIDRLIDFNNETQMTFGEAQIRDQIRTSSLLGLFNRQIAEVLTPVVTRSVAIKWRKGDFGVIPGSEEEQERITLGKEIKYFPEAIIKRLQEGKDVYEVKYKTRAANAAKAEEYIGIIDILNFATQAMQVDQTVRHRVDFHEGIKQLGQIRSVPLGVVRQDDKVQELIDKDNKAMENQQMLETAERGAAAYEKAAKGEAALR